MNPLTILIVDDDQWIRKELQEFLGDNDYTVLTASLPSETFPLLETYEPDIVILDLMLPEMDGLEVLTRIKDASPETEVVMMTGHGDMENVIQAMRLGASDYLTKPFRSSDVQAAIERTRKFIRLQQTLHTVERNYNRLSQEFGDHLGYQVIGQSQAMREVIDLMSKVASSDQTSVLLVGESGVGKELVARGIHHLSPRRNRMFCSVNTSAIAENLFESEFFGYKKGAFTGAGKDQAGWFQTAHEGTLFLDEISTMSLPHQAKLLRVLEERRITRVGSHAEIPVDVRIIAATNQNIEQLVVENTFRKDLYYRLNAFTIHIPPLRQRPEDLPFLIENFARYFSKKINKPIKTTAPRAIESLTNYHFPGNIRELKNMVERAVILCEGNTLYPQHFLIQPLRKRESNDAAPKEELTTSMALEQKLDRMETRLIQEALAQTDYNKTRAAKLLQISRQSLHRRIERLKIAL